MTSTASGQEKPAPLPLPPHNSIWNPIQLAVDNPQLKIKVLVLNYDPLVPSENLRRLSDVFKWGSPERLATRYKSEMEFASGGALRFEIVEWRNLNEIYAQKDGFKYTVEQYAHLRRAGSGWHEGGGQDYPRLLAEQEVPELIDSGKIDEVWIFSDHYFGLWEASMAGPGAFFINGGVYPEVKTRRPFAFYGFNYERGVAEMMHNTCHRTEATLNRFYGPWNLKEPKNNWEKFSANDVQSNGAAGVGTCHWPANATSDYNYGNERTVESWADDYLNYPNLTFKKQPVSKNTWFRTGGNLHLDYMAWYFAHVPRAPGVNTDGRQNNWWKYMMDFQNYGPSGKPLPPSARAAARDVFVACEAERRFTVDYSGAVPIDASSVDLGDLVVTGPSGYRQEAKLIGVNDRENGTFRVATYSIPAPPGGWTSAHRGRYAIALQTNRVRDAAGTAIAAGPIGGFQVLDADAKEIKFEQDQIELPVATNRRVRLNAATNSGQRDVTLDASWSSSDRAIAAVDATGRIHALKPGSTQIAARFGGKAASLTVVVKASDAPVAKLNRGDFSSGPEKAYQFDVTYTGAHPLVLSTIGFGDIRVSAANGFNQFAELVSTAPPRDPKIIVATYLVVPRGGKWWASDNGLYTIEVEGWQVGDERGRYVADAVLGTFAVNSDSIEPKGSKPPTSAPGEVNPKLKTRPKNAGKKKPAKA